MSRESASEKVDLPPGPVTVGWVRDFVRSLLSKLNDSGTVKENARVLLYGAQILGTMVKDADVEEEIAKVHKELAELKARIGMRVA